MPVGFNSPARNLFLIGSSGEQVVTNFFKTIDQSAGTDGVYFPDEIKYNFADQKFLLAGSAQDSNSKGFGWFEKRNPDPGNFVWTVRVEAGAGVNTTLRAMELDDNDNLIVVGKTGNSPWIAKYGNNGLGVWEATTFSGDVEYTGVTSDSNGNYYACGSTPTTGDAQAFVEKFDTNGNPGWGKSAFMLGRDVVLEKIAANNRGEVVAVGLLQDDEAYKGYIVKIDTNTGEVLWDRTLRSYEPDATFGYTPVFCEGVFIDSKDQIYVVGRYFGLSESRAFIVKYTAEGNMVWQKETPVGENIEYYEVKSDGETEQTVVFGRYFDSVNNDWGGILSKYSKDGTLVWRRKLVSSHNNSNTFGQAGGNGICLDADPSFYYLMYFDDVINGLAGTPDRYTFGKVSSSGNGLGGFEYTEGTGEIVYYDIVNIQDRIGKLSDGSVRNDTSDSITYPFNANKILFDDLTTQIANKKRQMDGPDSFEYSGSPAIRPADFQELNLEDETIDVTEFVNGVPTGQAEYTTAGSFSWTAPADVTSVSVVAVGGGGGGAPYSGVSGGIGAYGSGGGGGGLGWKNNIPVTPGQTYTVVVGSGGSGGTSPTAGGDSYFINTSTVRGGGGDFGDTSTTSTGGTFTGDGGGNGGNGAYADAGGGAYGGGGGAGGYSGNGGSAAVSGGSHGNGSGGGGGGGFGSGGGVGIYGEGANGTGGFEATGGSGGAAGQTYTTGSDGGLYGGGAGCSDNNPSFPGGDGAGGAVRIIWGEGRSFPSTLTADQTPGPGGLVQQTITKVKDKSGKGNNGTINGATLNVAGYWEFGGANDYILPDITAEEIGNEFTIEGWFRPSSFPTSPNLDYLISVDRSSGSINWALYTNAIGQLRKLGTGGDQAGSFGTLSTNTWYHILMTHRLSLDFGVNSLSEFSIYLNGTLVNTTNDDYDNLNGFGKLTIGNKANVYGSQFNGDVGEVRLYQRLLTPAQVFQNYNATREKYTGVPAGTDPGLTSTLDGFPG